MLNARWQAIALGLALSPGGAIAAAPTTGVVIDAQRGTAFVMAAGGGLEAVDVLSGQPAWSTARAARPIATHAGRVLAQAEDADPGRLRLVILDAERGGLLREAAFQLPSGAEARIDDAPGSLFRVLVEQSGPRVDLRWTSERRELKGVVPEEQPLPFQGRVRVDLEAGVIEGQAGDTPGPPADSLPSALSAEAEAGAFRERPRRMGALFVATQDIEGALLLRRWSAQGAPLPAVALPQGVTLQLASDDGWHVLLSRLVPGAAPAESHLWTVLSLDTGATAGELRAATAAARFALARGRVLYLQSPGRRREAGGWTASRLLLRAVVAAGGAPAWSRPVRDTAYRGRWVP